jgi:hypothetical protein
MTQNCPKVYGSAELCALACAKVDWPASGSGDSLQCRIAWATAAMTTITEDWVNACNNASPLGLNACGMPCPVYCRIGRQVCPDHFPEPDDCEALCNDARVRYQQTSPAIDFDYEILFCRFRDFGKVVVDPRRCQFLAPNSCVSPYCPQLILSL